MIYLIAYLVIMVLFLLFMQGVGVANDRHERMIMEAEDRFREEEDEIEE